jgi:hypothetical protein
MDFRRYYEIWNLKHHYPWPWAHTSWTGSLLLPLECARTAGCRCCMALGHGCRERDARPWEGAREMLGLLLQWGRGRMAWGEKKRAGAAIYRAQLWICQTAPAGGRWWQSDFGRPFSSFSPWNRIKVTVENIFLVGYKSCTALKVIRALVREIKTHENWFVSGLENSGNSWKLNVKACQTESDECDLLICCAPISY